MAISLKHRITLACAALLLSSAAYAQYSPDATVDLGTGYGNIAMSQSVLGNTRQIGNNKQPLLKNSQSLRQGAQPTAADMAAMRRMIEPEYYRRVRADGKASADAWLAQTAREMGMRAGQAARANGNRR